MKKVERTGYLLLAPAALVMSALVLYPIVFTFVYTLQDYRLIYPDKRAFVGLENYARVLADPMFWNAFANTLLVTVIVLLLGLTSSLVVASILSVPTRFNGLLTAVAIIPWALPPVVNGLLWKFVFYPGYGLLNKLLIGAGVVEGPIQWFGGRLGTLLVIALVVAWRLAPFGAIVLLASMQSIPRDVYEAATTDGASRLQAFWDITRPLLAPSIAVVASYLVVNSLFTFDEVIALVGNRALTSTLALYNYNQAFTFLNLGTGGATAYLVMLGTGIAGFAYVRSMVGKAG